MLTYIHRGGTLNANYCKLRYVRGKKMPKNANVICESSLTMLWFACLVFKLQSADMHLMLKFDSSEVYLIHTYLNLEYKSS